jgi:hypothetical protein
MNMVPEWVVGYFINPVLFITGLIIFFTIVGNTLSRICREKCYNG